MFVESRDESRAFFFRVWRRMDAGEALEPLENLVAGIIRAHPQYHSTLADPARAGFDDGDPAANPFLHMGLHIALAEQLQTDRPGGVRDTYRQVVERYAGDVHEAEHHMMDLLGRELWRASREGAPPDAERYLAEVRRSIA
jgi:phosphoglucomutase